jgi:hypothetical protein
MMITRIAVITLAVAAAVVAVASLQAPAPVDASAPATAFSAERAAAHVRALAAAPRPGGSPGHAAAEAYLTQTLTALGLETGVQRTTVCVQLGVLLRCGRVANVYARLRGDGTPGALLLAAHYDSVAQSPGAADDASGVATLLETARALRAGAPLKRDVVFLFTDLEEDLLLGAAAFIREHPWRHEVALALNFDARGNRGPSVLYELPPKSGELLTQLAAAIPHLTSTSFMTTLSRVLPNGTDALALASGAIPTLSFAFVDGYAAYHRATDTPAALSAGSLQQHGDYAISIVRTLGATPTLQLGHRDLVYFDVAGKVLVRYSYGVAYVLALLSWVWLLLTIHVARRAGTFDRSAFLRSAALSLALLVACAVVVIVLRALGQRLLTPYRLAVHQHAFDVAYVGIAFAIVFCASGRIRAPSAVLGQLALWLIATTMTVLFAAGMSFVFQWPLAFYLAAHIALGAPAQRTPTRLLAAALLAWPAWFLLAATVYTLQVAVGGDMPAVPPLVVVWALLGAAPLVAALPLPTRRSFAVAALALAGVVAMLVVARSDRATPQPDSLVYALDADDNSAAWVSYDGRPDSFTAQRLGSSPRLGPKPALDPDTARLLWQPTAPFALPAPQATLAEQHASDRGRTLVLQLHSPRAARSLSLWQTAGPPITAIRVDQQPPVSLMRFSPELDRLALKLLGASDRFSVQLDALGPSGVRIELDIAGGAQVELTLLDCSDGFPAALAPPQPRTQLQFPAPSSDETWVRQTYRF